MNTFETSRDHIESKLKRKLAKHSNFCCSICGSIPIVFHHIEEWAKNQSDDEKFLIPICDKCHRRIHGDRGLLYSKRDLYNFKSNPKKPRYLKDHLILENKKEYDFFIGSNFQTHSETASFFVFEEKFHLVSIDTSNGILKLNILNRIESGKPKYLIKENQLKIDTCDVWNMKYSGNSLIIWKKRNGKKKVFIDLILKPDVVIIKRMNTSFNGKPFKIFKLRKPQKRQENKLISEIKTCENLYYERVTEIDKNDQFPESVKPHMKNSEKNNILRYLRDEFCKEFKWNWNYYQSILERLTNESIVFNNKSKELNNNTPEFIQLEKRISQIKKKYKSLFADLKDIVVEYDSNQYIANINI